MIDTSVLVDNLVAALRDVPELVDEMGGDPERIFAYHDQYPKRISLAHALHSMPAPATMAVWQGTTPGTFGGFDVWKHQVSLFLRARETFDGDAPTAYYRMFRLITKGVGRVHEAGAPDHGLKSGHGITIGWFEQGRKARWKTGSTEHPRTCQEAGNRLPGKHERASRPAPGCLRVAAVRR